MTPPFTCTCGYRVSTLAVWRKHARKCGAGNGLYRKFLDRDRLEALRNAKHVNGQALADRDDGGSP